MEGKSNQGLAKLAAEGDVVSVVIAGKRVVGRGRRMETGEVMAIVEEGQDAAD